MSINPCYFQLNRAWRVINWLCWDFKMVSNCFASEQRRDELTKPSALKFCLVYAYLEIAKISFNNKLIFHGLIVALYYLILNHNAATSVEANILFRWVRIRSTFYNKRNYVFALLLKEPSLHDVSQESLWCFSLMVALGIIIANFFLQP